MVRTFLALGSNLGAREIYLKKGIDSLGPHGVEVIRAAGIYETEPREVVNQPWFLNTVVEANTELSPHRLLDVCLLIEKENLRVRNQPKSARTLDIDIIFYADQIVREPSLTIPHPRFGQRRFVLVPLAEIAPTYRDPITGRNIADLLGECPDNSEVRLLQKLS